MIAVWLLGVSALAVPGAEPSADAARPALADYEAVKATVGRDAPAQVKLALWCEAHGLPAERAKHLALAVLTDPTNATARGLLGLVEYGGRWRRPDAVTEKIKADEALSARLAEYNGRRARAADTADAQWDLAAWCESAGLAAEARAHFSAVTRLDPSRDEAWERLGCKKVGNRWVSAEQLAAEKAEADVQRAADLQWMPLITQWHAWLRPDLKPNRHKHKPTPGQERANREQERANRELAEERLAAVTDPKAVHAVFRTFARGDAADQATAVQVFGRIDSAGSSYFLAALGVYGRTPEVRRAAGETLTRRDPRDFLGDLIDLLRAPLKYEVRPVAGPGSPGVLFVEGRLYNLRRVYGFTGQQQVNMAAAMPRRLYDPSVPFNPYGAENFALAMSRTMNGVQFDNGVSITDQAIFAARRDIQIAQAQQQQQAAVNVSQQQLNNDISAVEAENANVLEFNGRILTIVSAVTGESETRSPDGWKSWWTDQLGYVYEPPSTAKKRTLSQFVANTTVSNVDPTAPVFISLRLHSACFAAGTPVRTLEGPRPIESIRAGDQVLTQDTKSGRLSFVPVLAVFHNKPASTLRIKLGAETVVATGIHRFWKAGHGWVMARDLKPGDPVRTVDGTVRVASVETQGVQPVFNLEVGPTQDYFVGGLGVLVHDYTLVKPVSLPFDAAPTLAALAPTGR